MSAKKCRQLSTCAATARGDDGLARHNWVVQAFVALMASATGLLHGSLPLEIPREHRGRLGLASGHQVAIAVERHGY